MNAFLHDELAFSAALLGKCDVDTTTSAWREAEAEGWDMTQVAMALRQPANDRMAEHNEVLIQIETMRAEFLSQYGEFAQAP